MSLAHLPPELYSAILLCIPEDDRLANTLGLTRAIPNAPIPTYHMFTRIRLHKPERIVQLYHRLRRAREDANYVKDLSLEAWAADGNVMVNLLALTKNVSRLSMFVGPDVTPELLHDAFKTPRAELERMSLRFRPYVRHVNYYQFLKGAYFDSFVEVLSSWPKGRLHSLSLVQELPNDFNGLGFAQPLVFFSLKPLVTLSACICTADLKQLRIQIPSRDIIPFITSRSDAFRSLEVIDVSTCCVSVPQIRTLLARFPKLQHIIADSSNAFMRIEEGTLWHALGRAFAFSAIERANEMEDVLKVQAALQLAEENAEHEVAPQQDTPRRSRPGRRGLATATISLRESSSTPSIADIRAVQTVSSGGRASGPKVKVLPIPSSLVSLSIDSYAQPVQSQHDSFRKRFQAGWDEGLSTLRAVWKRLQTSHTRGTTRVMAFRDCKFLADHNIPEDDSPCTPVGASFDWEGLMAHEWPRPVLCCAGSHKDRQLHANDCGHFCWDGGVH